MKKLLTLALLFLAPLQAFASFDGQTVRASYFFPDNSTLIDQQDATVGPGVEFPNFPAVDPRTNVDISATNILITYNSASSWTTAAFNGPVFQDLGTAPPITGVTINAATNMAGLDPSRISFDADSISINWNGLPFDTTTIVSLDVTFAAAPGALAVPALGQMTLVLLALSVMLIGWGFLRRRPG